MCVHMSMYRAEPGLIPWFTELQNPYLPKNNHIDHPYFTCEEAEACVLRPTFILCLVVEGRLAVVTIIGSLLPVKWFAQSKAASNEVIR